MCPTQYLMGVEEAPLLFLLLLIKVIVFLQTAAAPFF